MFGRAVVTLAAGSEGRTVESCMAGEEVARKDLEKDWAKIPAAERTQWRTLWGDVEALCRKSGG